jgi:DNA-binding transcriptional ArsR family regulator
VTDAGEMARAFKVLSVETRLRIVQLLKGQTLCVNALAGRLGVTPAAVSQHLRILRDAGLVAAEKHGYFVHYRLNEQALAEWRTLLDGLLAEDDNSSS